MSESHYQLFSCCVPVRGFARSAIYDLQRKDYWFIPNDLCDLLIKEKGLPISGINEKYKHLDIESYFNFLFENEICFPCRKEDLDRFPELDLQWNIPFEFETAIVDFNREPLVRLKRIVSELNKYAIPNIQIRFFEAVEEDQFKEVLIQFSDSNMKFLELIVLNRFSQEFIDSMLHEFPKIRLLILTNSTKRSRRDVEQATVFETTEHITSHCQCGLIQQAQFAVEMRTYCESRLHNSCLNAKVSIDVHGNIKNCPSMKESFGNICDTSIEQALQHVNFKSMWSIKKDDIEVCKDCEFRHMCSDCRAYLKKENNRCSQPEKCNYNPYIAKWKGEEGYVPIEHCGTYNNRGNYIPDLIKIKQINMDLWGG
ncbi:grasp-with-spasm system SPASM domain peptide maturase [Marinifilum caeruleilacunae]|uniref:Grasp-with-spasm system SPASM domain peptide maturase n=1 Tax=Marinifilum caeruleilacunae TaxID=2499076 RepID=A0ABX1X1G8_9BACT|nr:grasp-with-spasm system SPASM domain peptide maturase [Marinifilum caeruleilacunae]NOU62246.1 grasp-with-spasm system SPASM domain peptide maturase [Marinifilum caeruleilacunae]